MPSLLDSVAAIIAAELKPHYACKTMIAQPRRLIKITITAVFFGLAGCQSPASKFDQHARTTGLERQTEDGLVLYRKRKLVDGEAIHIYLDGDGTPSLRHGQISLDPTSRDRLILKLIGVDPTSSVLVGRPCYYGSGEDSCRAELWTTQRYSKDVVDRLVDAINTVIQRYPKSQISLIGYSGGGALAMLAAPGLDRVDVLITIAANLDTRAWVEYHGYAPLEGSLNPADQTPLPARIRQFHFFGEVDENVPARLSRRVLARQPNAQTQVISGFTHACCWAEIWARRLSEINRLLAAGS